VARAFGASEIIYSGDRDCEMMDSVKKVAEEWGGTFSVRYGEWRKEIKKFRGTKVHLTIYGVPMEKKLRELRKKRNVLVIIGGEKVPREVYDLADYNISVTNQPHSEIAALSVFLHEYFHGRELKKKFKKAKLKVVPQEKGKKVIRPLTPLSYKS